MSREYDIVVVGAGLSGVCVGYYLKQYCSDKSFAILEGRDNIGGTWDIFRYPGIRSDSDMYTFGFSFRPWTNVRSVGTGPEILQYIKDTAEEFGIDKHIQCSTRVLKESFSSKEGRWSLSTSKGEMSCRFLIHCTGYYKYDEGYMPDFAGKERFQGRIVHPNVWDTSMDYSGKRVAVVGSGATAITLVPALTEKASHVVMVQRSPTYMIPGATDDAIVKWLSWLPTSVWFPLVKWKRICQSSFLYWMAKNYPDRIRTYLLDEAKTHLQGSADLKHFKPKYGPWEQRLCLAPDGDFFAVIREKKASVITGEIKEFDEQGIVMEDGERVDADVVVSATGFNLHENFPMNDIQTDIDGVAYDSPGGILHRGTMVADIPNFAFTLGYINASWSLRVELQCKFICRVLHEMDARRMAICVPQLPDDVQEGDEPLPLSSGYVARAAHRLPKQGNRDPWQAHQNVFADGRILTGGSLDDGLVFTLAGPPLSRL
mmetsp:Transcript_49110/g.106951  ORF Transcript_49110/g.106951 Transcript_49110/m.106951 type:complete len:486 (-) Transcript_49110:384-1841(-)